MKRTDNLLTAGLFFGLIVVLLSSCAGTVKVTQPAVQTAPLQPEAAKPPVTMAKPETPPLEGKVVETMNAGSYTYISLEKDGKKGWVAVPFTEVAVGQEIKVKPGTEMGLFSSKTLKRSFDNITFSPGLVTEVKSEATQAQPAAEGAMKLPAGHKAVDKNAKPRSMTEMKNASASGVMAANLSGKVVETMDAGGYTYINLEKDGKQTWAAVPNMRVTVGENMELQPGAVMTNFTSKSLNKTFESVVFSGGPVHSK
jgi:predicted lipoprotein